MAPAFQQACVPGQQLPPTPSRQVMPPVAPMLGELFPLPDGTLMVWLGDRPHSSLTRLDDPNEVPLYPNQFRPDNPISAAKQRGYHIIGLIPRFDFKTAHTAMLRFLQEFTDRLRQQGMAATLHAPNPADPSEMLIVTENHAKFTLECIRNWVAKSKPKWDSYSRANDKAAVELFKNSISHAICQRIHEQLQEGDDTCIVFVLAFARLHQSNSIHRFNKLKDRLREIKLQHFPGQNVTQLVSD